MFALMVALGGLAARTESTTQPASTTAPTASAKSPTSKADAEGCVSLSNLSKMTLEQLMNISITGDIK